MISILCQLGYMLKATEPSTQLLSSFQNRKNL
jgi:hypothetical protein